MTEYSASVDAPKAVFPGSVQGVVVQASKYAGLATKLLKRDPRAVVSTELGLTLNFI
jgi:hypothetical protein